MNEEILRQIRFIVLPVVVFLGVLVIGIKALSVMTPAVITITEIQLVESSRPITLGSGAELVQCGVAGMNFLQLCESAKNIRWTLSISGRACNDPPSQLDNPKFIKELTWDIENNCK